MFSSDVSSASGGGSVNIDTIATDAAVSGYAENSPKTDTTRIKKEVSSEVIKETQKSDAKAEGSAYSKEEVEQVSDLSDKLSSIMQTFDKKIQFQVHEGTDTMYVSVVNSETGETIRSIPPEALLDFMAKFEDMVGLIYDEQA